MVKTVARERGSSSGRGRVPPFVTGKRALLRWLRVRASGRGRTFFMEGRFTGFGTDSFIAVAIVRPLLCGTGRIDGGEMVAKTKVKPIDGKRELQSGSAGRMCRRIAGPGERRTLSLPSIVMPPRPPPNRPPRSPNGIPEEAGASEKCVSSG